MLPSGAEADVPEISGIPVAVLEVRFVRCVQGRLFCQSRYCHSKVDPVKILWQDHRWGPSLSPAHALLDKADVRL